jgi:tetratricopeptide (TPR) repeat protein
MRSLVGLSVAIVLALGLGAQPVSAADPSPAQQLADQKVVQDAMVAGFAGAREFAPKLQAVVANAPASYLIREVVGDTVTVRGALDSAAALGVVMTAALGGQKSTQVVYNTYPNAAFLLGSYKIEARDPRGAIEWLDKGLALQPTNLLLVCEKASALFLLQRFGDALALLDEAAAAPDEQFYIAGQARLQRTRGFALVELNRLDEAEAAYKASLVLEPDHGGAKNELTYIAQMRAGREPAPIGIVTGDKAAKPD